MKAKILVLALLVGSLSACSVKTCPTYAKKEVKEIKTLDRASI
jgi:hypothetical protein